jgi:hypothetical protein
MRFQKRLNPLISKAKSLSPLVFGDLEFRDATASD